MISVYAPFLTHRLKYTLDFCLTEMLGLPYKIYNDKESWRQSGIYLIHYQDYTEENAINIPHSGLLAEKGVKKKEVAVDQYRDLPVLFPMSGGFDMPFDVFSAVFYLLSRYEEYLPYTADMHGRFPPQASLAYRHHFLQKPVVNHYIRFLEELIHHHYPELRLRKNAFHFTPTYDIDAFYAYRGKGLFRNAGGLLMDVMKQDRASLLLRWKVWLGLQKDPLDVFDEMMMWHKGSIWKPIFFIHCGDYDQYDKSISIQLPDIQVKIKSLSDDAQIGIHPSYASNEDSERLNEEIQRLRLVLKSDIQFSRQHFLKLRLPDTCQQLIEYGIQADYTMGYAQLPGFRAGTCSSFYFYDLEQEMKTKLRMFPFTIMDATLQYYMKLSPEEAQTVIRPLLREVMQVNGHFITLWHNHSLSEMWEWKGWKTVYLKLLEDIPNGKS